MVVEGDERITVEGTPLATVVDLMERREIAEVAVEESKKYKPAIISNIHRKPKYKDKGEHGKTHTYGALERFGYLIEKGHQWMA